MEMTNISRNSVMVLAVQAFPIKDPKSSYILGSTPPPYIFRLDPSAHMHAHMYIYEGPGFYAKTLVGATYLRKSYTVFGVLDVGKPVRREVGRSCVSY